MGRKLEYADSCEALYTSQFDNISDRELVKEAAAKLGHLRNADLSGMDLRNFYLDGIDLSDTNFSNTIMANGSLQNCKLVDTLFDSAYINSFDFSDTDLSESSWRGTIVIGCWFNNTVCSKNMLSRAAQVVGLRISSQSPLYAPFVIQRQIIPTEGSFTAFKAVTNEHGYGSIAKLEILADAQRVCNNNSRKCRASAVKVLAFLDLEGNELPITKAKPMTHPWNYPNGILGDEDYYFYQLGEISYADAFDSDPNDECTSGIHFFLTFEEAVQWVAR
jgi:hypothetical protein